jgi:hypothetical protein
LSASTEQAAGIGKIPPLSYIEAIIFARQVYAFDPRLMPDAGSRDIVSFIARRLAQRRAEATAPDDGDDAA